MALYMEHGYQILGQETPARAFMALKALEDSSTQSWPLRPKVKWVSSVTPRILGVLFYPR